MFHVAPSLETLEALFACSGNQCAFPGCSQPLINDRNQLIGMVCPIESVLPNGKRYNQKQTDQERIGCGNLILLCYPHHVEVNNGHPFPVEKLKKFKRNHEASHAQSGFTVKRDDLLKIVKDLENHWLKNEQLNITARSLSERSLEINARVSFFGVFNSFLNTMACLASFHELLRRSDEELQEDFHHLLRMKGIDPILFADIPQNDNPFRNRNWLPHNIHIPNYVQQLEISLLHLEIKYLEEFLKTNQQEQWAQKRLLRLKEDFARFTWPEAIPDPSGN